MGIAFRLPRGAQAVPLPQPTVFHYRYTDGRTEERFLPRERWYPSAYRGRWEDSDGLALLLGYVGARMAVGFPGEHVTPEEYDRQAQQQNVLEAPANHKELMEWIEQFALSSVKGKPRVIRSNPRLQTCVLMVFESEQPSRVGVAFQFGPNARGIDPYQWFFSLFEWTANTDMDSAIRSIEQDFIPSLTTVALKEEGPMQASSRFQRRDYQGKNDSPAFAESRERAINSIVGLRDWWFVETPRYVLVSNLSGGRRSFVQRLQEDLETMRSYYEQLIAPRSAMDAVSLVRVFGDDAAYKDYVGEQFSWTGGVWMPSKRELVIRSFEWGDELDRRARMAQIVYHEAFHQYLFYAFDMISTSPWYNEGHAVYVEGADTRRQEIPIAELAQHEAILQDMIQRNSLDLWRFLYMDYDEFYQHQTGDAVKRAEHYALGWGLIYYLRKGAPLEPENTYEQILNRYAESLWKTRDPEEATRFAFDGVDTKAFADAFVSFWTSSARRHRAERYHE